MSVVANDVVRADSSCCDTSDIVWTREGASKAGRDLPCYSDLHICVGLWKVMGAAGLVGAERAVPIGDEIGRAEHGGVCEHAFHGFDSAVFSGGYVPSPVWDIPVVRGVDYDNEQLHLLPVAGDQTGSY